MEKMTPQEIFQKCDELKGSDMDWKQAYATVFHSIESNQYRVMRAGNTLFWYHIVAPQEAQMYVFNADSQKNFLRNMKEFAKAMDVAGFKKVFGITENQQLLNMIGRLGYPMTIEDAGQDANGNPLYKGTVNV
jgi:uncharacterized protein (DUF302 family)